MSTFDWNDMRLSTQFHLPRFIESLLATEAAEDWSRVRSQSRAKRRMKRGFRQNVRHYRKPACFFIEAENTYYIHPELMKEIRNRTKDQFDNFRMRSYEEMF